MAGSSVGQILRLTTFGESHGPALGGILDGVPSELALTCDDIQPDLNRRRPGNSKYTSSRKEIDKVEILSGLFEGKTTGAPIGFLIYNCDQRTEDYNHIRTIFRPGHADYTYYHKYGHYDYRGGGRASARETVNRVVAGAIAKKWLSEMFGITIHAYLAQIGTIQCKFSDWNSVENNPFFCPDQHKLPEIIALFEQLSATGNSIGAKLTVIADNVPIGWGEPVFDRLDALIAKGMMSINAVKAVAIGDGFDVVTQFGSDHRDALSKTGFASNHAGGILGGISNGEPVVAHVAFKPTSSISQPIETLNKLGTKQEEFQLTGRHDPCVGIRAVPIVEAMMALILMDAALHQRAMRT